MDILNRNDNATMASKFSGHAMTGSAPSSAANRQSFYGRELLLNRNANLFDEHTIDMPKTVNFVAFSPFDNSFDIFACGTQERVYVYRIAFLRDEDSDVDDLKFDCQFIHDYITGSKATSIAFSPKTNFSQLHENVLNFAIVCDDFCMLILQQHFAQNTPQDDSDQQFISGHTDYINDMAFEPITGHLLASTSDDCTCCVWSLDEDNRKNNLEMKILLSSPGINVKWHPSEPNKLFVSEKRGLIRFYDTNSRMAVMSFECNRYPLMASDWCTENNLFIGCVAGKSLFLWDTSLTSLPIKQINTNFEGLSDFEFYDSKLVAYRGRPNNFLQVQNFTNNQIYIEKEFVAGRGISWNRKLPILAVGGSKAIHIFKINSMKSL